MRHLSTFGRSPTIPRQVEHHHHHHYHDDEISEQHAEGSGGDVACPNEPPAPSIMTAFDTDHHHDDHGSALALFHLFCENHGQPFGERTMNSIIDLFRANSPSASNFPPSSQAMRYRFMGSKTPDYKKYRAMSCAHCELGKLNGGDVNSCKVFLSNVQSGGEGGF
jgi:hypothetical protein